MKTSIITVILLLTLKSTYGQINCFDTTNFEINRQKTHNVVGLIPSNARCTNGWGIGWSSSIEHCNYMDSVRINGMYTNISPFQLMLASMSIAMIPFVLFSKDTYKHFPKDSTKYDTLQIKHKLNGVSIGLFEDGEGFTVQGLQVTALYHSMDKLNGISLSILGCDYKQFNGMIISGIYNHTYKGNGLQIGLINSTKKMKGVQIGLWNKIGNFGFPIINFRFRKNE